MKKRMRKTYGDSEKRVAHASVDESMAEQALMVARAESAEVERDALANHICEREGDAVMLDGELRLIVHSGHLLKEWVEVETHASTVEVRAHETLDMISELRLLVEVLIRKVGVERKQVADLHDGEL